MRVTIDDKACHYCATFDCVFIFPQHSFSKLTEAYLKEREQILYHQNNIQNDTGCALGSGVQKYQLLESTRVSDSLSSLCSFEMLIESLFYKNVMHHYALSSNIFCNGLFESHLASTETCESHTKF